MTNKITAFADSHETAEEIVEAIFYLADDSEHAERIWQNPDHSEVVAIAERATKNHLIDAASLRWGAVTLQTALEQCV